MASTTHAVLTTEAANWLRKKGCSVVITEMAHGGSETADAIGWKGTQSFLVECKTSLADFRADAGKVFRRCPDQGMGNLRYFCALRGLLKWHGLPVGWGLLEWDGKKMRLAGPPTYADADSRQEISLLLSSLRRVAKDAPEGISVRCFIPTTPRTAPRWAYKCRTCRRALWAVR